MLPRLPRKFELSRSKASESKPSISPNNCSLISNLLKIQNFVEDEAFLAFGLITQILEPPEF